jgi:hypothetical protein
MGMKARAARVNEKALVRLAVEVEAGLVVAGVEEESAADDLLGDYRDWDDYRYFDEDDWREPVARLGYRQEYLGSGVVLVGPAPVRFERRLAV